MAIKDSGYRTQFFDENGNAMGVRDMHEGKGRFDLLPMCVLMRLAKHYENGCKKYGDRNWEKGIPCHSFADSALRHLVKYLDGWDDEDHLIAAIWNLCGLAWNEEKRPDLMDIPARMEKEGAAVKEIATEHGIEKTYFLNTNAIVEALAKQIPKKPIVQKIGEGIEVKCPVCGDIHIFLDTQGFKYCPECGNVFDWSDDE